MVAVIKIKNALATNFHYNENKVAQGVATCLAAENYPKDLERLTQAGRFKLLKKLASLNSNIKTNSVHISLNFDPSENLSQQRLREIANEYMNRIGFGEQPYLVYQHFDAGHPHIHLLSVKVGWDGKGIDTHHIGIKKSEPARKDLERQYRLVRAEDMSKKQAVLKPAYASKIQYGKVESRRAIANVLEQVVAKYNYTSVAELNAVLRLYNVMADRCKESSRVFREGGLLYRILDDNGKPVGVPIKASAFYNKPGLKFLQERFAVNEPNRQPLKKRIKNTVDLYFLKQQRPSLEGLKEALRKDGIDVVARQGETGLIYGITYVDHKNKVVFNGSELGKPYSAKLIQERCLPSELQPAISPFKQAANVPAIINETSAERSDERVSIDTSLPGVIDALLKTENSYQPVPYQLKKSRKKRKKKGLSNNQ